MTATMTARRVLLPVLLTFAALQPIAAQERKNIFADPQNLKVLPENISASALRATMKGIAMGTGLRCESCHVGEAGQPLTTFDFASDEKALKEQARVMLRMVLKINGELVPELDDVVDDEFGAGNRTEVRCVTCHRGRAKPRLIEDVLDEKLATGGTQAAVKEYESLREQYYGGFQFDFSEMVLPMYAQRLAATGNAEAALAFARTNVSHYPTSAMSVYTLAELYAAAGNAELAIENYQKVIDVAPQFAPQVKPKLEALMK
ncbi:MAG: c-type cytochrome [Pseudomonadota bacterium]